MKCACRRSPAYRGSHFRTCPNRHAELERDEKVEAAAEELMQEGACGPLEAVIQAEASIATRAREFQAEEETDQVARLLKAKPKETRTAMLALLYHRLVRIEGHSISACYPIRRALHGEEVALEDCDRVGRCLENLGFLQGLAARVPVLKGPKLLSVFHDCVDLMVEVGAWLCRGVEDAPKDWTKKAIRVELAGHVRDALRREPVEEKGHATFSPDEVYRLDLTRTWDASTAPLIIIGLNPSTATATENDPTINRGRSFARREHAGSLCMLNLFAYRSTDPMGLLGVEDPVGPGNDETIRRWCRTEKALVVAAWGSFKKLGELPKKRALEVIDLVHSTGSKVFCFGKNADGTPKHPLYLSGETPLIDFD